MKSVKSLQAGVKIIAAPNAPDRFYTLPDFPWRLVARQSERTTLPPQISVLSLEAS